MVLSVWDDEADEVLVCVMVCLIVLVDTGGVIEKDYAHVATVYQELKFIVVDCGFLFDDKSFIYGLCRNFL